MIYSETIEIIHSEIIIQGISSAEEPDYRVLDEVVRFLEDGSPRWTEENDLRTLEDEP